MPDARAEKPLETSRPIAAKLTFFPGQRLDPFLIQVLDQTGEEVPETRRERSDPRVLANHRIVGALRQREDLADFRTALDRRHPDVQEELRVCGHEELPRIAHQLQLFGVGEERLVSCLPLRRRCGTLVAHSRCA